MNIVDSFRALRSDLKKHLLVGIAAGFVVAVVGGLAGLHPAVAGLLGIVVGDRMGWVKEYVWDRSGKGVVDRDDYLHTGRGALIGAALGALVVGLSLWT